MGVDIHTVLQVKRQGKWETIATDIYDGRNYALFSVLAGVRGQEEPIAAPRGYPKDFRLAELDNDYDSDEPDMHVWVQDWCEAYWMGEHSHSWLTLEEINTYFESDIWGMYEGRDLRSELDYFIGLRYLVSKMIVLAYDQGCVDSFEDVRLVFGFDS